MIQKNIADISVIVNIYNEEDFLHQCIDSILSQTIQPLEIILVDDGSSDKSPLICQEYAEKFHHIHCILQHNCGLVHARKAGLRIARGKYIAFVDGDDWLEAEWYEELYSAICDSDADIVVAGHTIDLPGVAHSAKNKIETGSYSERELIHEIYPVMLNTGVFSQFGIYSYLWNKLFRKSILTPNLMSVDEHIRIGEDACSVYPAILQAKKVRVLDCCGYHYRQRLNSMVKTGDACEKMQLKILFNYLQKRFLHSDYSSVLLPQLENYMLSHIVVRTNGLKHGQQGVFPFLSVSKGSRVVLYGAGTFGQHIYRRAKKSGMWDIAGWIDQNSAGYQTLGLDVLPLSALKKISFDCLVVGFVEEDTQKAQIRALNLSEQQLKKVVSLHIPSTLKDDLLRDFFSGGGENS